MAETVFKKVDYTLKDLVGYIQMGEIGLPDIQRPFVWKNAKVRDLFDSIARNSPAFWAVQCAAAWMVPTELRLQLLAQFAQCPSQACPRWAAQTLYPSILARESRS